jgi:hypothetical protein
MEQAAKKTLFVIIKTLPDIVTFARAVPGFLVDNWEK